MSKKSKKSKKKGSNKQNILAALVLILIITNVVTLVYFIFVDPSIPIENIPLDIGDVAANSPLYLGKPLTLKGYYVISAGYNLLVSHPLLFFNNSLNNDNYVIMTRGVTEQMSQSFGKQIAVKGILERVDPDLGTLEFSVESFFDISSIVMEFGSYDDELFNPYDYFDSIPHLFDPNAEKYAVLFSGGIKPEKAHSRYWNDIIYMYFILQMHGYESENIYVIYKDGIGEDSYTPVHYPATHASMNTVFDLLSQEMGAADTLFFYTTNHGGSGGISVWGPMDSSGALTHSQVSNWLDSITCRNMIIVMEQCRSGKFISHLSAPGRVILTACKDDQSSYGCDTEGNWDEFVYHFMCALVSIPWNGDDVTVDADLNVDGQISMREAFVWAAAFDSRAETPWYNDNGDGYGYHVMQVAFGSGPWYGDTIFL